MSARSLPEWLARLEGLHPKEIDMGLDRVRKVAQRLDVLQPAPLVFTVTGTNGKGSTCAGLDSLLRQAGMSSGRYTSPHLIKYNERVVINGDPVPDEDLCEAFSVIEDLRDDISLTYFEFGTLAALWLFKRAGVDAAVLEVGLGGRLDAVNVVDADVAVVTSIGLDHQEYLGNTRDSVGYEKAGVGRSGRPLITGERDLPQGFIDEAGRIGATVVQRGEDFDWFETVDGCWGVRGQEGQQSRELARLPAVQLPKGNLTMAIQALWAAGVSVSDTLIAQGLREAYIPGRLERRVISWRGQPRKLYLDVGHNPQAAGYLAKYLRSRPASRQAVFGLLVDKDLSGVVSALSGSFESWAAASLQTPRSRSASELAEYLIASGERVSSHETVAEALLEVLDASPASTEIVVFGSFFCVAEAILWLSEQAQELIDG